MTFPTKHPLWLEREDVNPQRDLPCRQGACHETTVKNSTIRIKRGFVSMARLGFAVSLFSVSPSGPFSSHGISKLCLQRRSAPLKKDVFFYGGRGPPGPGWSMAYGGTALQAQSGPWRMEERPSRPRGGLWRTEKRLSRPRVVYSVRNMLQTDFLFHCSCQSAYPASGIPAAVITSRSRGQFDKSHCGQSEISSTSCP